METGRVWHQAAAQLGSQLLVCSPKVPPPQLNQARLDFVWSTNHVAGRDLWYSPSGKHHLTDMCPAHCHGIILALLILLAHFSKILNRQHLQLICSDAMQYILELVASDGAVDIPGSSISRIFKSFRSGREPRQKLNSTHHDIFLQKSLVGLRQE